jgi:tetratricopeptide (TPR) repeat protein
MPTPHQALESARAELRSGHFPQAEQICAGVLSANPDCAEAWSWAAEACRAQGKFAEAADRYARALRIEPAHPQRRLRLAEVLAEVGRADEAIAAYQEALRLRSDLAEAHYGLGNVLSARGDAAGAIASYRQALAARPDYAEALTNLGVALARQGDLPGAVAHLRRAVEARPDFAKAHHNLGVALAEAGRPEEAAVSLSRALELNPAYAEAHFNLANTLKDLERHDEAADHYRRALDLRPDYAEAMCNLGLLLTEAGRPGEAAVLLGQAIRLRPDYPEGHNNLGLALTDLGRFGEAAAAFEQALRLNPHFSHALSNLGSAYKEQGRSEEAVACYDQALRLEPDAASTRWNRALAWLQMGEYERGWPEYEWRWRRKRARPRPFRQPLWDGAPLAGRTLLLHCEQGLGDAIQFVRYAALARAAGGRVVVECPGLLRELFATASGPDQVVAEGEPLPPFDVQAPLMSLPAVFKTSLATVPADVPYLHADHARQERWRQRLAPLAGFKVGIVWQGNPYHKWDRYRSVALARFAPLAYVPGVCLVSVQQVHGTEQLARRRWFEVTELEGEPVGSPGTFADTAALLTSLDLLVTVDTAVAHLAGALAAPVWLLLAALTDWRWLLKREDCPWYPTMRLFRQRELGDWEPVFERVADELRKLVARRPVPADD